MSRTVSSKSHVLFEIPADAQVKSCNWNLRGWQSTHDCSYLSCVSLSKLGATNDLMTVLTKRRAGSSGQLLEVLGTVPHWAVMCRWLRRVGLAFDHKGVRDGYLWAVTQVEWCDPKGKKAHPQHHDSEGAWWTGIHWESLAGSMC